MLSLHSRRRSTGHSAWESRPPIARTPCQTALEYIPIIKCSTPTRALSSAPHQPFNIAKAQTIDSNTSASSLRLRHSAGYRHHPARRRCNSRHSRRAPSHGFHNYPQLNTEHVRAPQQRKRNNFPATWNTTKLPDLYFAPIMARKGASSRVSKADTSKPKKAQRRGRLTAFLVDEPPPDTFVPSILENNAIIDDGLADGQDESLLAQPCASQAQPLIPTTQAQDESNSKATHLATAAQPAESRPSFNPLINAEVSDSPMPKRQTRNKKHTQNAPEAVLKIESTNTLPHTVPTRNSTPEAQIQSSSSELSSAPSSIGSTPPGLVSPHLRHHFDEETPLRRSTRTRKRSIKTSECEVFQSAPKRRKTTPCSDAILSSIERSPDLALTSETGASDQSSQSPGNTSSPEIPLAIKRSLVDYDQCRTSGTSRSLRSRTIRLDDEGYATKSPADKSPGANEDEKQIVSKHNSQFKSPQEKKFYAAVMKDLQPHDPRSDQIWRNFDRSQVIMYGADAQTQYTLASAEQTRRGGRSTGRGATRGARGGTGNGRNRGGKGRNRGRDEDSPEPPPPKKPQSLEDAMIIKHAKLRQAELKKIFHTVGVQQGELLDMIAGSAMTRLVKKAKAHKQVPEYDEIVEALTVSRESAEDLARVRLRIAEEAEVVRFEAEKAAIENSYRVKVSDLQKEYEKGAQGDLIIFRRAIAASHDETHTQDGSEVDCIPQYHELPEPDQNVRGYTSTRITDEKPFKRHLLTYDDEARREVIDDDVGPIIQAFARKNAERRAEEERKKTQTLEALSEEADKQLKEIRGYLIPRPFPLWRDEEVTSFALSTLADVAEHMARRYPNKQYIYMPLADGDTFPKEALNFDRLPGLGAQALQPPPTLSPPGIFHDQRNSLSRSALGPPMQPTRRSLRNLQPNGMPGSTLAPPATPVTTVTPSPALQTPVTAPGPTVGPHLAPASSKLAPVLSTHQPPPRPPPIDTKGHIRTPPEQSPVHPTQNQTPVQQSHSLAPLQPRHMSQGSLPPPQPHYGYPQPFSPTHPSQSYPPPPPPPQHHAITQPYPHQPLPSPYHQRQQQTPAPSPYLPYPQQQPAYHGYPPHYYPSPHQPHQQHPQQQYSFMAPQQGPPPQQQSQLQPQSSPAQRTSSNAQSTAPLQGSPHNPPPHHESKHHHHYAPLPNPGPYQNGYHSHNRSLSNQLPPPIHLSQQHPPPPVQQLQQPQQASPPPARVPAHTTGVKGRARPKAKQPIQFVNQTQATRRLATEHQAKEEEAAAAAKREKREKDKEGKGRKLAPKV